MNEKEKQEFYIANCKCCLLAETMKRCHACLFNIGLTEKMEATTPIPISLPIRMDLFVLADQQ